MLNLLNTLKFGTIQTVTKKLNESYRFEATTEHGLLDGESLLRKAHFGPVLLRSNPYIIPSLQAPIVGEIEDDTYTWWVYATPIKTLFRILNKHSKLGVWIRSRRLVSMLEINGQDTLYGLVCCIYGFWTPFIDPEYKHPYVKDGYIRRSSLRVPHGFLSAAALFLGDTSIPTSETDLMGEFKSALVNGTPIGLECTCTD